MSRHARLTFKDDPGTSFSMDESNTFLVGRSQECDFQIPDSFVSRRQAKIYHEGGQYIVENIGNNPVFVNGSKATKRILSDNDEITFGKTVLVFRLEERELETVVEPPAKMPDVEPTVFVSELKKHSPRLVVTAPDGQDSVYPLIGTQVVIGRLAGADVQLADSSVSRRHCLVERRNKNFFAKNLSDTNPTLFANKPVSERILYSGDQLRIGLFTVSFISNRPEDIRPAEEKVIYKGKTSSLAAWLVVAAVVLAVAGFFAYSRFYAPWKTGGSLKAISQQMESGDFQVAHEALKKLLALHLPPNEEQKAMDLFSKTTLINAQKMAEAGRIKDARDFLTAYLNNYKTGEESKAVRDQVDEYRFRLAQDSEASGDNLAALREYSSIGEESAYFDKAQQAVSRIWLSTQQKELSSQPIDQLLREAEEHFQAKRYTTPFNNNAYAIYQTILTLDPNNPVPLQRINQMKLFYRENGDKYFSQKNYAAALSYYERYLLIDPQDAGVNEKAGVCRKSLPARHAPPQAARTGEGQREQEDRVKRLIEGGESN